MLLICSSLSPSDRGAKSRSAASASACAAPLERVGIGLAGADADGLADVGHENLAVADLAGLCRCGDRLHHLVGLLRRNRDLDLHLRQEIHRVFGAAINLGMALLAAIAFDLGYRHAGDAEPGEGVAHVLEFEWLDDGNDKLHGPPGGLDRNDRMCTHRALSAYTIAKLPED